MFINSLDLNIEKIKVNPGVSLSNSMMSKKSYDYPDPYKYFILSAVGKFYTVTGNNSVLLNPAKGYYAYPFSLSINQGDVVIISKELFKNSKPLSGKALLALDYALKKAAKQSTSFLNRL